MQPDDPARDAQHWQRFVTDLADTLGRHWPAMPERLGERYGEFVTLAVQQAEEAGLQRAAEVARLVNLWFVWGPGFQDRAGFAWAPPLLAEARVQAWSALHRLVRRSVVELTRLPGSRITPQTLEASDAALVTRYAPWGRRGALLPTEPEAAPLQACDLESATLAPMDDGTARHYLPQPGPVAGAPGPGAVTWQRVASPAPAALRIGAGATTTALPAQLHLLSPEAAAGAPARLQARLQPLAQCQADHHPQIRLDGPHGRWTWAGHASRAASWPMAPRPQALPRAGAGGVVAEETAPEYYRLAFDTCGLRDEGQALGPQQTTVSVWPASQWCVNWQRPLAEPQPLLPGPRAWQATPTACRVERDGQASDARALQQHFSQLDQAIAAGIAQLLKAWCALPAAEGPQGRGAPSAELQLGVLSGRAGLSWGWRAGPTLADAPWMRLATALDLMACSARWRLGIDLLSPTEAGGLLAAAPTRLLLQVDGDAPLRLTWDRDQAEPPLAERLAAATVRWHWPVRAELQPLASPSGRLLNLAGPTEGALVGEAGLRPCTSGSSGWEWFAALRLLPVTIDLAAQDPLLGQQRQRLPLLPTMTLLDWRLG